MSSFDPIPDPGDPERFEEAIEAAFPRARKSASAEDAPAQATPARGARLEPGAFIDDYRLVARIGRGGFGEVWEAEQTSLRRRVALKFLRPERADRVFLEYFAREARAGGRLAHPGVVAVYAQGESGGQPWIAMELIEGGRTLLDWIEERRVLARESELPAQHDRRAAEIAHELARTLHAVHARGVIHRDLKPRNVFSTPDGHWKLGDFGLARIVDETALSDVASFAGTYAYMSPEQIAGRREALDHRTDVFSLGSMLYELLALRQPFEGDTPLQVCAKIQHGDPAPLTSLRSRVPSDLVTICNKALEKEPSHRYADMAALAEDLRRHLAHETILARPPRAGERLRKWVRRHPTRSAASAVAGLAFIAISVLFAENLRARHAAERAARLERERAVEVTRLSAFVDLEALERRADELWPAEPTRIPDFESWIRDARRIVDGLPAFRAQLAALDERLASSDAARGDELERWWRASLAELVQAIEAFADERTGLGGADAIDAKAGWSVPKRLAHARLVRRELEPGGGSERRWTDCVHALRARWPELEIEAQPGLVPIGVDPHSGLFEFWDVQSGDEPLRGKDGALEITEGSGLVFVLLPSASFLMGAQSEVASAPGYDATAAIDEAPVHRVELSAHFLSKYEMTQGQWLRLTGRNPSTYRPGAGLGAPAVDLRHPVEHVDWDECVRVLARAGWTLPTEAQWEHAARGDTSTPWWTGAVRETLFERHAANLADVSLRDAGSSYQSMSDWPELDDGWPAHAPAGTYAPNPFGLHEVHGNVWEWCLDVYGPYSAETARDPLAQSATGDRVQRGGSFIGTARHARSSMRTSDAPSFADATLGLRPARRIGRPSAAGGHAADDSTEGEVDAPR